MNIAEIIINFQFSVQNKLMKCICSKKNLKVKIQHLAKKAKKDVQLMMVNGLSNHRYDKIHKKLISFFKIVNTFIFFI